MIRLFNSNKTDIKVKLKTDCERWLMMTMPDLRMRYHQALKDKLSNNLLKS